MVSAAKLRRAQERALAARPYAQMLTNVLKSLVSRAEIYDPETGEPKHPLLAQRPEKNILLIVVTGDKGLAGAFNTNILKAAAQIHLDRSRARTSRSRPSAAKGATSCAAAISQWPSRGQRTRRAIAGEPRSSANIVGVLNKVEYAMASELAERVIDRYTREEIDSVYIVYNEFKSVIAQRLVVEQILPIEQIGRAGGPQCRRT